MRTWSRIVAAGIYCLVLAPTMSNAATIYACKKKVGGTIRIVKATTVCLATETKMSWPDAAEVAGLKAELASLKDLLQHFSRNGNNVEITGANLWITSGSNATDGAVNGLGNLIVGYNEERGAGDDRTGSHNIVVGRNHNYSGYGGLVAGYQNTLSGVYSSVSGGNINSASGPYSSVSGGEYNTASGYFSSVSGGGSNTASGPYSSVSGGARNTASGQFSSVSGGARNTASGQFSSVSGGYVGSAQGTYDWIAGALFQED